MTLQLDEKRIESYLSDTWERHRIMFKLDEKRIESEDLDRLPVFYASKAR